MFSGVSGSCFRRSFFFCVLLSFYVRSIFLGFVDCFQTLLAVEVFQVPGIPFIMYFLLGGRGGRVEQRYLVAALGASRWSTGPEELFSVFTLCYVFVVSSLCRVRPCQWSCQRSCLVIGLVNGLVYGRVSIVQNNPGKRGVVPFLVFHRVRHVFEA